MRIPLVDICSGSKCRFFCTYGEVVSHSLHYTVPYIRAFYDKTELRTVTIRETIIKRHWYGDREKILSRGKVMKFYHVVYELYDPTSNQHLYCKSFGSVICEAEGDGEKVDSWDAEQSWLLPFGTEGHRRVSNPHTFIPIEKLDEYKKGKKGVQWQEIPKCPSFVCYPVQLSG